MGDRIGNLACAGKLPTLSPAGGRIGCGFRRAPLRAKKLFVRAFGGMGKNVGPHALRVAVKDAATTDRMVEILTAAISGESGEIKGRLPFVEQTHDENVIEPRTGCLAWIARGAGFARLCTVRGSGRHIPCLSSQCAA